MSAHDQMRAMLDELMGTGRDGENNKFQVAFDDARVCKSFLLACCPHDILSSTRMDLGDCSKIHDLALRADYELASKSKDYYYDIDAMEHLSTFIGDCDRKVESAKRKLKETQEELSDEVNSKADSIHQLGEQLGATLARAEQEGAEGNVQDSLKLMEEVEELKKQKTAAEAEYRNSMPASSYQQQKLRVCEVCSAYLGIHDNDRRLADHFGGKLHLGFISIRDKLDNLKQMVANRRNQREKEREERREREEQEKLERQLAEEVREREREQEREQKREENPAESEERNRGGSKSRGSKERSRGDSKERSRGGSRERRRRSSRSRSRHRRSRSRDRDRRRARRSRSRSRSRNRHNRRSRRSRSRSRSHRKSRRSSSRSRKSRRSRSGSRSKHSRSKRSHSRSPSKKPSHESRSRSRDHTAEDKSPSPSVSKPLSPDTGHNGTMDASPPPMMDNDD